MSNAIVTDMSGAYIEHSEVITNFVLDFQMVISIRQGCEKNRHKTKNRNSLQNCRNNSY